MSEPFLQVAGLHAWYGESHVLHGVDFEVRAGEVVTLLGRNGAGKTTTLKSVMGIVPWRTGSVRFRGEELIDRPSNLIARRGLAFCPEERGIFASLTVEENLLLPPVVQPGGLGLDAIYELFPNLRERGRSQGTKLSGGEQQMLTIGRALMTNPELLILDEATEGLAPLIAREIWRIIRAIKDAGIATVIVDKNFHAVSAIAERAVLLVKGASVYNGSFDELRRRPELHLRHLGV